MKLLKFELKKTWRRKQFFFMLLFVLVMVLGVFFRNVTVQDEIASEALKNLQPHIQEALQLRSQFEREMEKREVSDTFLKGYDNALQMNDSVKNWELAILDGKWDSIPYIEHKFLQEVIYHIRLGGEYESYTEYEIERGLDKSSILLELNLPYENDQYSISMPNYMKSASTFMFSLYSILILIILLGDIWSTEWESNTINTLYTQPYPKWKIVIVKYTSLMIVVLFVISAFIALCMVVPFVFRGTTGSFSYPQLVLFPDGYTYISIGQYLVELILIFIGAIMFSYSLVLFFSLMLRNRFSTMIVTIAVISCGSIVTNSSASLQAWWNPFYYFRFHKLIERPDLTGQWIPIVILSLYSCVIILLCTFMHSHGYSIRLDKPLKQPFRKGNTLEHRRTLRSILIFEWRKLRRQQYLKQLAVSILLAISVGYLFLAYLAHDKETSYLEQVESGILSLEQQAIPKAEAIILGQEDALKELNQIEGTLSDDEKGLVVQGKALLSAHRQMLEMYLNQLDYNRLQLRSFQKKDWGAFYAGWINTITYRNSSSTFVDNLPTERIGLSDFTYKASIQEKEWLAKHQLEPAFNGIFLSTIYDRYANPLDRLEWARETGKVDDTGLFYLYLFFDSSVSLLFMAILVLWFGNGFTTERVRKSTLSLLLTQPLSRSSIYTAKFGLPAMITCGAAVSSILLMVLIGTVGNRFGDWTFPVLYYDTPAMVQSVDYSGTVATEGGFHFIHMGNYLLETSALLVAASLFLISLSIFISVFFKHTISSILTMLFVTFGGYYSSTIPQLSGLSHWSPFTYVHIGKIANGELAAIVNNGSINTFQGIAVFILFAVVLVGVGIFVFRKKKG